MIQENDYQLPPIDRIESFKTAISEKELVFEDKTLNSKYEIVKTLGKGGFGDVLLVQEKETCQKFAIKKQLKLNPKTKRPEEKVMEEYHLMQRIKSPFVAKAYETFQDDKAFYFVTELLDTDIYKYMQKYHSVSKSQTSKIQNEELKKCLKFLIASIFQSLEHIHE